MGKWLLPSRKRRPKSRTETLSQFITRTSPRHTPIPWHLTKLIALFERAAREPTFAIVSMPPRHGKTVTVCSALAWAIETYPERLNAYVSYAADAAASQSRRIRKLVQADGVPLAKDANRVDYWLTDQEGGLAATGIGGQLTGKGFQGVIVVDDPIKGREQAESMRERDKAWETFNDDAWTRREPPCGSVIVVQTRWHLDDLAGRLIAEHIEDGPKWEVLNLPAIRDDKDQPADDGKVLWPERMPLSMLKRQQAFPYTWASLYQGHPVPRGGKLFRVPARYTQPELNGARIFIGCDPAGSTSTRADYTAAVVIAVTGQGDDMRADVLEVVRLHAETAEASERLLELQRKWSAPLHIEASRDGKSIAKSMRLIKGALDIVEVPIAGDKWTRSLPVASAWNEGRVRLPVTAPWVPELIGESEQFTGVADRHDDQIDALAYAWQAATAPVYDADIDLSI